MATDDLNWGNGEWRAKNFTAREYDPKKPKGQEFKENPGWKPSDKYREGWDRIFGKEPKDK